MLFINISSDNVFIGSSLGENTLSNQKLEINFPKFLKQLYTQKFFDNIFLLNGPGSFTTLRIGTLCLNMLNFVFKDQINIYTISKIELYKIFVNKGWLPNIGYIFIGQKKNIWKYDFSKNSYELVPIDSIEISNDCFIDQLFTDNGLDKNNMIKINYKDKSLILSYKGNEYLLDINELKLSPYKMVEPNYMISPNISTKE